MIDRVVATSPSTSAGKRSQIIDEEFGVVAYRRSPQARFVRIRIAEDGTIRASLPKRAPLYLVKELIESSRAEIRKLIAEQQAKQVAYEDGMSIGHSHRLHIAYDNIEQPYKKVSGQALLITLPHSYKEQGGEAHRFISSQVKAVLKREAKAYLPRRLRYLADTYGFDYERERFGNQRGRWGSCSSSGTISLNVALMNLPHELIDYVLIHELAHTRQMNHSPSFWEIVESCMPDFRLHRKTLKSMSPIC
jgi:predicted metal-dependent hydrolase